MLKVALAHGKEQPNGPREEVPKWTYFSNPASTPPTTYYHQTVGSAANFALDLSGLPRGHWDQSGVPRPCKA